MAVGKALEIRDRHFSSRAIHRYGFDGSVFNRSVDFVHINVGISQLREERQIFQNNLDRVVAHMRKCEGQVAGVRQLVDQFKVRMKGRKQEF
jgi:hypothetical protein